MTHAQKATPIDMKIATIKPRPSSRCLVTAADMNVSGVFLLVFTGAHGGQDLKRVSFCSTVLVP